MSLPYIGQQITIYGGFFLLIAGVVGNGINVLVFSTVRAYRTTPCTFYFLCASIYNIIYLSLPLTTRIFITGFAINSIRTSTNVCKIRLFIGVGMILTSLTCSCLATIDQFFSTSQSAHLRRFSKIKWAYPIVIIITIIWLSHGIPFLFFFNISPVTSACISTDYDYSIYYPVIQLGLYCVIPSLVMVTFGYLAYRNINQTRVLAEQRADRQLMRMTLVQIILVLISFIPFGTNNAYGLITSSVSKDTNRLMIENFSTTVTALVVYFYPAVCLIILCKMIKEMCFV